MAWMETQVEELADNRVRLQVEVGSDDVRHAVEHAASDLAASMKIPGFRKGHVPMPVLLARVGRERLYAEAVESHIGSWFRSAAASSRIRPVAQPEFGYDPPSSADESFRFTATVAVQPKPELPDWGQLEVPYAEPEVPAELVEQELEALRSSVAELVPVEDRPVAQGDTLVVDLVGDQGEAQRDYVVELGQGKGEKGEGPPAARRRPRALDERVRDAGRAARGDRVAPARTPRARERGRIPAGGRPRARPGREGGGFGAARRGACADTAPGARALARAPRHLARHLCPDHRHLRRRARRAPACGGAGVGRRRARARGRGRQARHLGLGRGARGRAAG